MNKVAALSAANVDAAWAQIAPSVSDVIMHSTSKSLDRPRVRDAFRAAKSLLSVRLRQDEIQKNVLSAARRPEHQARNAINRRGKKSS